MSPLTLILTPTPHTCAVRRHAERCRGPNCLSVVHRQAFMDDFRVARQQLSLLKDEAKFNALIDKYPKAERYMRVIYEDRKRWAEYVSPLAFSACSWTTSRVEGAFLNVLFCSRSLRFFPIAGRKSGRRIVLQVMLCVVIFRAWVHSCTWWIICSLGVHR